MTVSVYTCVLCVKGFSHWKKLIRFLSSLRSKSMYLQTRINMLVVNVVGICCKGDVILRSKISKILNYQIKQELSFFLITFITEAILTPSVREWILLRRGRIIDCIKAGENIWNKRKKNRETKKEKRFINLRRHLRST